MRRTNVAKPIAALAGILILAAGCTQTPASEAGYRQLGTAPSLTNGAS
jgi:hypothetical protein